MINTTTFRSKPHTKGFSLVELIAALVIGLFVISLLIQLGFFLESGPDSVEMVTTQYDTFAEVEELISEYRNELENNSLNLNSLLASWTTSTGATLTTEDISVSATDGSYTFRDVKKVTVTKNGQAATAYLTQ